MFAFCIIFALMIVAGVLTLVVPAGGYERIEVDGRSQVVPDSFAYHPAPHYPIWRWFSASAKAFLMMPILTPLADLVGITRQTAVLAFGFGDGFSNMLYPTGALLLIGLSFTTVAYPTWLRWTIGLQLAVVALTGAFLAAAVAINFGPF